MDETDMTLVQKEGAFTLDVQIYVNSDSPERVQTVTLCNVLSYTCRCPICACAFASHLTLKTHMETHQVPQPVAEIAEVEADPEKVIDDNFTCVAAVQSGDQHFIFITQQPTADDEKEVGNIDLVTGEKVMPLGKRKEPVKRKYSPGTARNFPCHLCPLSFPTSTKFGIHLRTHTGEKPFSCETCGKKFVTRGELTVHVRVHTGDKPYTCTECGTCHRTRSSLHGHIQRYHKEKAYECTTCEKKFAIKSYYQAHLRIHDESNPFKCPICQKSFAYQSFLDKHVKSHPPEEQEQGASPPKVKKKRGRKKGKKTKAKDSAAEDSGSISEKEKIAVEVLQKGKEAGNAAVKKSIVKVEKDSSEQAVEATQKSPIKGDNSDVLKENSSTKASASGAVTSDDFQSSSSPGETTVLIPEGESTKQTVFQIQTMKNGTPETIYVSLGESDLQQISSESTQLRVVQTSDLQEGGQLPETVQTVDIEGTPIAGQNFQLVSDSSGGVVYVTENPISLQDVGITEADQSLSRVDSSGTRVAAILESNATDPEQGVDFARRVDAVVQELEKRINTNE